MNLKENSIKEENHFSIQKIHEKEEQIQSEWREQAALNNDAEEFATDGLLFRGEIHYVDGYWRRERGNEVENWNNSSHRLLILTKDLNDEEAWDIREETGRRNMVAFSYERAISFYKNLRMWSYGLLQSTIDGYPSYDEARDMDISGPFYETAPIARINCKKQVGGSSISDQSMMYYLETYSEFLLKQIALYDADMILCCGCSTGKNLILDFIRSQYLKDLICIPETDNWIYYSPSTHKIIVNSYHPSARIGYEDTYINMMKALNIGFKYIKKNIGQ